MESPIPVLPPVTRNVRPRAPSPLGVIVAGAAGKIAHAGHYALPGPAPGEPPPRRAAARLDRPEQVSGRITWTKRDARLSPRQWPNPPGARNGWTAPRTLLAARRTGPDPGPRGLAAATASAAGAAAGSPPSPRRAAPRRTPTATRSSRGPPGPTRPAGLPPSPGQEQPGYPGQDQTFAGQDHAQWQLPGMQAARPAQPKADGEKGFVGSLFDFSSTSFVTPEDHQGPLRAVHDLDGAGRADPARSSASAPAGWPAACSS